MISTMTHRAFTLVETLVAISIIMVAIIGPFTSIENDLIAAYTSRDELIANSLAQEGIEYIHFMRDTEYLTNRMNGTPQTFLQTVNSGCITSVCTIDPNTGSRLTAIASCVGVCAPLYIDASGRYTQLASGNTLSRFTRSFQFCYMNGSGVSAYCNSTVSSEVRATVTVTWSTEGRPHTTTVTDYLQDWLL
jgi:Tfp pilus assembly protein PilV